MTVQVGDKDFGLALDTHLASVEEAIVNYQAPLLILDTLLHRDGPGDHFYAGRVPGHLRQNPRCLV